MQAIVACRLVGFQLAEQVIIKANIISGCNCIIRKTETVIFLQSIFKQRFVIAYRLRGVIIIVFCAIKQEIKVIGALVISEHTIQLGWLFFRFLRLDTELELITSRQRLWP